MATDTMACWKCGVAITPDSGVIKFDGLWCPVCGNSLADFSGPFSAPDDDPIDRVADAWQEYDLRTNNDGTIGGMVQTNDDEDRGGPSIYASWPVKYRDLTDMMKHTGGSHQGISCRVEVYLDGNKVDDNIADPFRAEIAECYDYALFHARSAARFLNDAHKLTTSDAERAALARMLYQLVLVACDINATKENA